MNEFLKKYARIFSRKRRIDICDNISLRLIMINDGYINSDLEIKEAMILGLGVNDIIEIIGEIKAEIVFIKDKSPLTIEDGYIVKIKLPAAMVTFVTGNKKEIDDLLQEKKIIELPNLKTQ